jgi:TP901 family phage tail tape measure protein
MHGALLGLGVGFGLRIAIKQMADFETAIAEVSTLIKGAEVDTKNMEKTIINMSKKVGKSATELAKGAYQVLSAGITDASDSMMVLDQAAKASIAGITDTFTAVDILTTALNAYGREAEDVTNISDVLFTTVRLGKTTFSELANTLGNVLPFSSQLGISIEEVGAAMATLTAAGISTDIAATSLRATFVSLIQNADKFQKLGIDIIDVVGKRGMAGAMAALQKVTEGNLKAVQELFPETRSLTAVLTLAGKSADSFAENISEMNDATGATEQAYGKMSNTIAKKTEAMIASIEAIGLSLSNKVIPPLSEVVKHITNWVDQNDKLIQQKLENAISLIGNSLKSIVEVYNSVPQGVVGAAGAGIIGRLLTGNLKFGVLIGLIKGASSSIGELRDTISQVSVATIESPVTRYMATFWKGALGIERSKESMNKLQGAQEDYFQSLGKMKGFDLEEFFPSMAPQVGGFQFDVGAAAGEEAPAAGIGGAIEGLAEMTKEQQKQLSDIQKQTEQVTTSITSAWQQSFLSQAEMAMDWSDTQQQTLANLVVANEEALENRLISEADFVARRTALEDAILEAQQVTAETLKELADEEHMTWLERLEEKEELSLAQIESERERLIEQFAERLELVKGNQDAEMKLRQSHADALIMLEDKEEKEKKRIKMKAWKEGLEGLKEFGKNMATQKGTAGKIGVAIEKAFAIKEAIINTKAMAVKAFNSLANIPYVGTILGIAAAAAAIAFGFKQISDIRSAHQGLTFAPAEEPVLINRGERVITPEQNRDLTTFLSKDPLAETGGGEDETDRETREQTLVPITLELDGNTLARILAPAIVEAKGDGVQFE